MSDDYEAGNEHCHSRRWGRAIDSGKRLSRMNIEIIAVRAA
jgi:hypothetical protein